MGIPSYYHSIIKKRLDKCFSNNHIIDYLAIDFNCAIHGCVKKVDKKFWKRGKKAIESEIIRQVIIYMDYLIQNASPQKGIGIFVDGPVHLGKMKQQRDRRFKKSIEEKERHNIHQKHGQQLETVPFDTNAITPGTLFMENLCSSVRNHLYNKYSSLNLEFSGEDIYGEGEHKCFEWINYLTSQSDNSRQQDTFCIYGLDADLIMLSLLHVKHTSKILLQREVVHFGKIVYDPDTHIEKLLYFDITEFSKHLISEYRISLEEYTTLCFLMGNDFVPHHPGLEINKDGIDLVIDIYKKTRGSRKIIENNMLQWNVICNIFKELASREYELLLEKENTITRLKERCLRKRYESDFERDMEYFNLKTVMEEPLFTIKNNGGYKDDYYRYLFQGESDKDYLAKMYFGAIKWTFDYYFVENGHRNVSTEFHYPFDYAPLFQTMYDVLYEWVNNNEDINDKLSIVNHITPPISTLEQRLIVLPRESHNLIHELQELGSIEELGLDYMYGKPFKFQNMFKPYGWMSVPELPPISLEVIRDAIKK
jgi:5'-3' exonuclease